jgi:hypothetical protein
MWSSSAELRAEVPLQSRPLAPDAPDRARRNAPEVKGDQDRRSAAPRIVIGLDTHRYPHVAVALAMVGEYSPSW